MEAAWREHVGQLTLAQLSSSEACQKHLNEFELQLVSTALGQTVIGSVDDIQEKIASVLRCHPHPDAKSMTRLSSIHQSAYNAAIVDEILKEAERAGFRVDGTNDVEDIESVQAIHARSAESRDSCDPHHAESVRLSCPRGQFR